MAQKTEVRDGRKPFGNKIGLALLAVVPRIDSLGFLLSVKLRGRSVLGGGLFLIPVVVDPTSSAGVGPIFPVGLLPGNSLANSLSDNCRMRTRSPDSGASGTIEVIASASQPRETSDFLNR